MSEITKRRNLIEYCKNGEKHQKNYIYPSLDWWISPCSDINLSIKARNLCLCVCVCVSNISADQDQTDLRFSTWLLCSLRVCNVRFVWTTIIPLINYFINDLPIPLALSTIATIVMCASEPITAEPETSGFILQRRKLGRDFASGLVSFCASKLTVVD